MKRRTRGDSGRAADEEHAAAVPDLPKEGAAQI